MFLCSSALHAFTLQALILIVYMSSFGDAASVPNPPSQDNTAVVPFRVKVSDDDLEDLKYRLKNGRIGTRQLVDVHDFSYGVNVPTIKSFQDYWLNDFDWRKQEKILNSFSQYTTQIEGLKIHFIHQKPPRPSLYKQIVPLMIVHGWPGNVFDFYKLIPMLTDPKAHLPNATGPLDIAFEVVTPSIPGYGWSDQPFHSGFTPLVNARVFNTLMVDRLGFNKYVVQGGDWGFVVAADIAILYPERLYGLYLSTICHSPYIYHPTDANGLNDSAIAASATEELKETAYWLEHATKPDTVGTGLNDSPIGLMTYMLEKFSTWTNYAYISYPDGGLTQKFTKDELLTSISIYWFQQNIVSSQRYYKEAFKDYANNNITGEFVTVPTAYGASPHDIGHCQKISLPAAQQLYNICQYTAFPTGGHFAALENPAQLAADVLMFSAKAVNNTCHL